MAGMLALFDVVLIITSPPCSYTDEMQFIDLLIFIGIVVARAVAHTHLIKNRPNDEK